MDKAWEDAERVVRERQVGPEVETELGNGRATVVSVRSSRPTVTPAAIPAPKSTKRKKADEDDGGGGGKERDRKGKQTKKKRTDKEREGRSNKGHKSKQLT